MKPALITRSGAYAATSSVRARSQACRGLGWSATDWTKVGIPAASARASPATPGRSDPTATTCHPVVRRDWHASISACSKVPVPEMSTTARAASRRARDRRAAAPALPYSSSGEGSAPARPRPDVADHGKHDSGEQTGQTHGCRGHHQQGQQPRTEIGQPNRAQVATGGPGQAHEHAAASTPASPPTRLLASNRAPAATGSRPTRRPPRPALRSPATTARPGHPGRAGQRAEQRQAGQHAELGRRRSDDRSGAEHEAGAQRVRGRPDQGVGYQGQLCEQQRDAAADPGVEAECRAAHRSKWRIRPVTSSAGAGRPAAPAAAPSTARGRAAAQAGQPSVSGRPSARRGADGR